MTAAADLSGRNTPAPGQPAAHRCWTVSDTSYLRNIDRKLLRGRTVAVHYQAPPRRNENGSTSFGFIYPILIVSAYMADRDAFAERVAAILNQHWDEPR